jgi:8-oxo-dGTP pyrophosphatase MutT (NUDIX family)
MGLSFTPSVVSRISATLSKESLRLLPPGAARPVFSPRARSASVLVPLVNDNGIASVLFTVRSRLVPTHAGQVSFPGGHIEQGETPEQAALREAIEEVGEGLGPMTVLGDCEMAKAVTGTKVVPVIAWVHNDLEGCRGLKLSEGEVDEAFTLPIEWLLDSSHRVEERLGSRGVMPAFVGGPNRVWGLTAFILDAVLRGAVEPAFREESEQEEQEEGGGRAGKRCGLGRL